MLKKIIKYAVIFIFICFFSNEIYSSQTIDEFEYVKTPPNHPTEIKFGLYLIAIEDVSLSDHINPTYELQFFMDIIWIDPRESFNKTLHGRDQLFYDNHLYEKKREKMWWPDIIIQNEEEKRKREYSEMMINYDGTIEYHERFTVTLHGDLNLTQFPFDKQDFIVEIESFSWDINSLILKKI